MKRELLAGVFAGVLVTLACLSLASEPPRVYLESMVLSSDVVTFDMKVLVASEEPWGPRFDLGIHWDPAVLDLLDVNLEGTVLCPPEYDGPCSVDEHGPYGPEFYGLVILFVNLKPNGRPAAGIFVPLLIKGRPLPSGPAVPLLNLRFTRVGEYLGPTETMVRLGPAPCFPGAPWPELPSVIEWRGQRVEVAPERGQAAVAFVSGVPFRRGDVNGDLASDISDAIAALSFLFQGTKAPPCLEAADANADGVLDISDPVYLLNFLFAGSAQPPEPFGECGRVAEEALGCDRYGPCA